MPIPATGGRPKTPQGHYDDAMLEILEMRGAFAAFVKLLQKHYREERDALSEIDESLRSGALSLRYSEIQERMLAATRSGS